MPSIRSAAPLLAAAALALLAGCNTTVTQDEMSAIDYGPKPAHWEQNIRGYLRLRLVDPVNAVVEMRNEPTVMYQRATEVRGMQAGWAVCVWVNDKNRSGAYDGYYPMTFFIRNEKIVAVNNGPDDFGVIGAMYARRQCAELGAPFTQKQ